MATPKSLATSGNVIEAELQGKGTEILTKGH